jgi:hypothetical protein
MRAIKTKYVGLLEESLSLDPVYLRVSDKKIQVIQVTSVLDSPS